MTTNVTRLSSWLAFSLSIPILAYAASVALDTGATPRGSAKTTPSPATEQVLRVAGTAPMLSPAPPAAAIGVSGNQFVDASGQPVILKAMNWEGFNTNHFMLDGLDRASFKSIVANLKSLGFNAIRIPFASDLLHIEQYDPARISPDFIKNNPEFTYFQTASTLPRDIMYHMITELTNNGFYVIIDNHQNSLDYYADNDGLWFDAKHSADQWVADWRYISWVYRNDPKVIGYELRNEVRASTVNSIAYTPTWGKWNGWSCADAPSCAKPQPTGNYVDWRAASMDGAKAALAYNSHKIVFLGGFNYQFDLSFLEFDGDYFKQLNAYYNDTLGQAGRFPIAYSAHSYSWLTPYKLYDGWYDGTHGQTWNAQHTGSTIANKFDAVYSQDYYYQKLFGFLTNPGQFYTGPVWVSEFGSSDLSHMLNTVGAAPDVAAWEQWTVNTRLIPHFQNEVAFIQKNRLSFAYYSIAGFYPKQAYFLDPNGNRFTVQCNDPWSLWLLSVAPVAYVNKDLSYNYETYCQSYGLFDSNWKNIAKADRDWRFQSLATIGIGL